MKTKFPAWVFFALGSFLCFGITNSLLGALFEWSGRNPATSISAPFVLWATMGWACICAALFFKANGRGFKGLPSSRFAWIAALAGLTLSLGMLTLKLGLASDPVAKGPIVAITSTNAMIVALCAWVVLHETLSKTQLLGMFIIVSGISAMTLGHGASTSLRGVFFGLATMAFFGITNFLLKYVGHNGADSISATVILWLSAGICGIVAIAFNFIRFGRLPGMERAELVFWAILAGVSLALGMLFIKLAVTKGPAGPATAITGSNSILVGLFEFFVFAHIPPAQKIIGMVIALLGIVVLAIGNKHPAEKNAAHEKNHG